MTALMEKLTVNDRPRRAQGKIMNLVQAVGVGDLIRKLPSREVTVFHASAEAPHLVSISASAAWNLVQAEGAARGRAAWARAGGRPHCNTFRGSGLDPLT